MRLEDICKVFTDGDWIESKDQSDEGIRLVQTGNIGEGKFLEKGDRAKYISEETFDSLKCTEIFPGDILVSRLPEPVGRACIIPEKEERMITAVDCTICRPDENMILKEYLCYFMQSEAYYIRLMNNVTGTTRKRISRKNLGNVELDIPDKETQAVVVKNLDILSRIIDGRKEELDKLDELIKARFVEMFGDIKTNNMNWDKVQMKNVVDIRGRVGWKGYKKEDLRENGPLVLGATHLTDSGDLDLSAPVFLSREKYEESPEIVLQRNDLIFTQRGNTIGKVGLVEHDIGEATINPCVLILRPQNINPIYLKRYFVMEETKDDMWLLNSGSAQPMITQKGIGEYYMMLPPKELQDSFADFVNQVDKSKVA